MSQSSLYSVEGLNIPQTQWCRFRCKKCQCQFTVSILDNDTPIATFCFSCKKLWHYSTEEQNELIKA